MNKFKYTLHDTRDNSVLCSMGDKIIDDNLDTPLDKITDYITDILPHGSGINGGWSIWYKRDFTCIYASNRYDAMNETGMYCHVYDFTLTYKINSFDTRKACSICDGKGYRNLNMFQHTYRPNLTMLECITSCHLTMLDNDNFKCNGCNGNGYNLIPQLELIRLNFHGQKEYYCCGYGLKDYIFETCYNPESNHVRL